MAREVIQTEDQLYQRLREQEVNVLAEQIHRFFSDTLRMETCSEGQLRRAIREGKVKKLKHQLEKVGQTNPFYYGEARPLYRKLQHFYLHSLGGATKDIKQIKKDDFDR